MNRIIWGAEGYQEIRVRHSSGAPDRFMNEVAPALVNYANASSDGIRTAIANAQNMKIGDDEAVDEFLIKRRRFTETQAKAIKLAHLTEEHRPIETLWDATTAVTAYAKGIAHQNDRVAIERSGGEIMELASK